MQCAEGVNAMRSCCTVNPKSPPPVCMCWYVPYGRCRVELCLVLAIWAWLFLLPPASHAQAPVYPIAQPSQPAMPPVSVEHLGSVLGRDLALEEETGELRPGSTVGIVVGVVQHGVRKIFAYGTAKPNSVFEIGSITKTFTATLLAQRVVQGVVRLDEPVRELLPPGTVYPPLHGPQITLLSLSDHHSGLPSLPTNLQPSHPDNPFADYDSTRLYAFINEHGVGVTKDAPFSYSNVGEGLLGLALADQARQTFPVLLKQQVLAPLRMSHTGYAVDQDMRKRLIQGHSLGHQPAHATDLDALAGAGGLRSDAQDMLTYLEAQLHPEQVPAASSDPAATSLPAAIRLTHVIHAEAFQGMHIALNWFHIDKDGSFWHGVEPSATARMYSSTQSRILPSSCFAIPATIAMA